MQRLPRLTHSALLALALAVPALAAQPAADVSHLPARPAPKWLTEGVMYQIWLRSFTPEGTLAAAAAHLPQLADLGVTVLYMPPVQLSDPDMRREFWSKRQKASGTNNPRNPYRISDYNQIDPEYGTDADLRQFVQAAHKLGMRVLLDLVYFHCGPTSPLLARPDFVKRDASGKVSTGNWNFPVLNFECQGLREYLWANMEHWVKNFDVDGFRCDVADSVPLDFWEEGRVRVERIKPDIAILAEGERRCANQLKAFDISYGFSWRSVTQAVFTSGKPASSLREHWEATRAKHPQGARFLRYTENHDIVNDMFRAEVVSGERGAAVLTAINFTLDGMPLIYNGQEIGDTSPQSIYADWPVGWQIACLPKCAAKLEVHKTLCRLRRAEPALHSGEVVWLDNDQPESVVSFLRRAGKDEIITLANLSSRPVSVTVKLPEGGTTVYRNLVTAKPDKITAGQDKPVPLANFDYFIGKR